MKTENYCQVGADMAPIIKWSTHASIPKIKRVECTKETEQCIWLSLWQDRKPSRVNKRSKYDNFHDSWEDAKEFLLGDAQRRVESALCSLESANSYLDNVKELRKPEEEQ